MTTRQPCHRDLTGFFGPSVVKAILSIPLVQKIRQATTNQAATCISRTPCRIPRNSGLGAKHMVRYVSRKGSHGPRNRDCFSKGLGRVRFVYVSRLQHRAREDPVRVIFCRSRPRNLTSALPQKGAIRSGMDALNGSEGQLCAPSLPFAVTVGNSRISPS